MGGFWNRSDALLRVGDRSLSDRLGSGSNIPLINNSVRRPRPYAQLGANGDQVGSKENMRVESSECIPSIKSEAPWV